MQLTTRKLDPHNVPIELRAMIGLAEQYGLEDDEHRADALSDLTPDMLRELARFIQDNEPAFDQWLAGDESPPR